MNDKLYFSVDVDCEPLRDKSPKCGGPSSWEVSEKTIIKFLEIFEEKNLLAGLVFSPTPEAANAHYNLFKDLKKRGIEIGIQPNVPGFRFPTYKFDLGCYDKETQKRIIKEAIEDFEKALGFSPAFYVPCCGSRNKYTYSILYELGFKVVRAAGSGRYYSSYPDACTVGMFPFPHWASEQHHIIAGSLPLLVVPTTCDFTNLGRDRLVVDLRPERPPTLETLASYRYIIDMNIEVMNLIEAPIKSIVIGTHNTEYVHFENLEYVIDYAEQKTKHAGMEFVPTNMMGLRKMADSLEWK
jgi:hypothetical protein